MKAVKKNSFLLRIMLGFLVMVCAFLCVEGVHSKHEVAHAAESARYATVHIGDLMEVKDYTISSAGGGVPAESMRIVYPSGGVYGGDKFVIQQAGRYQVTYYATVDGQRIEETKTYMAIRKPQDMIIADAGVKVEYGMYSVESPYELTKETYGAKVYFKAGQSITFATSLKTEDLTSSFNFLEMIVQPSVYGETDFEKLTVRLTDEANENNYVEYLIESSNLEDGGGMVSYVRAGASGRQYGGFEGTTFHLRNYGAQAEHSFRGWGHFGDDPMRLNKTVSESALTLALDHKTKEVYCGPESNMSSNNRLVNDLDDPTHYKSDPWAGFSSENVIVSIKAESFSKSEGVLLIKSFGGYNFTNDIEDNVAPEITFDYDMSDRLPVAYVGTRFPMIPFTAEDALDKTVKTNVWVNHINKNGKKITIENDGESFFVEYVGVYEVIYSAEDYSGNRTEKRLEIIAQESKASISIDIDESLVEADVYSYVAVPYVSEINIYGGSGTLKAERAVYSPSKQLLTVKDKLQLTELGDYTIVYQATDYYGNVGRAEVTIRSKAISEPKFVETPVFTDVLLKGFNYELPEAFAVETVNGEVISLPCKTYVNGTLTNGSFKADGTEMTIRYVAEGTTGVTEWENTLSVVDTEKGKYKSKYFYSADALQIIDQKDYLEFSFSDNASATFVNAISSQELSLSFLYEADKANFSEMTLTLTDASLPDVAVTFYFFYDQASNKWSMRLNNGPESVAYAESKGILSFIYSANNKKIIDTSGEEIAVITACDNGEVFDGFSEEVYLDIAFANVRSESSMYLTQICNQVMGYSKKSIDKATDEIKPIIVLDGEFVLRQKLGSKANIPTAKAYDVLGQIAEFTVSVELNGAVLVSGTADKPLDILLDKAGYYNVTYYAKDTHGNHMSLPYMVLVSDETAPTLTVKNSLKDQYKVGDKITIPTYSATDNGANCYIQVMVVLPDNEMRLLHYSENGKVTSLLSKDNTIYDASFKAGDNTFVAEKRGRYVLRVLAYDEYYNYTVYEFEFWVK